MKSRVFRSLSVSKEYRPWSQWEIGDFVIGKFEDQGIDNYKKACYILKVDEVFFNDEEAQEKFKVGELIGLNHNGILAKVMASDDVNFGDIIRIEYQGMNTMSKGNHFGKDAHSLLIQVAEEGDDLQTGGNLSDDDSYDEDDTF